MPRPRPSLPERFLWAQAVLVAGWWTMLLLAPHTRAPFLIGGWPEATLLAFLLPDLALLVGGSALAALGLRRGAPWARAAFAAVLGAVLYATMFCLAATFSCGGGELGAALMALCALCNAVFFLLAGR